MAIYIYDCSIRVTAVLEYFKSVYWGVWSTSDTLPQLALLGIRQYYGEVESLAKPRQNHGWAKTNTSYFST